MRIENMLFQSAGFGSDNRSLTLEQLARKAGFIWQEASGIWSLLTLGASALEDVEVRAAKALRDLGADRCALSLLQDLESWEASGRVEAYGDELMKAKSRSGRSFALGATAEEAIAKVVAGVKGGAGFEGWCFQIGAKWRDELRARGGLIRAKEFRMLDAYSFSESLDKIIERHGRSVEAFKGLVESFGLAAEAREADCREIGGLGSTEIRVASELGDSDGSLEVGHLFVLGDKYSKAFGARGKSGAALQMGCQGLGTSRLLMALLESRRDDRGFWGDEKFRAADVYVMNIGDGEEQALDAERAYHAARDAGFEAILDLRKVGAGKKLADAELACVRRRIVFSDRKGRERGLAEICERKTMASRLAAECELFEGL